MLPKSPSLSEKIADHLAQQIILGQLTPREHLPEAELAKKLDVSTNSLREAFRLLQARHLVEIQARRGTRVCDITPDHVRDLYEFLFLLLSRLASEAADVWQGNELDNLVSLLAEMESRVAQGDVVGAHYMAFRLLERSLGFTHNRYLIDAIEDLMPLLQRYSYLALQEEPSEVSATLKCLRELVDHVRQRDREAAAAKLREYGDSQCQIVLRALERQDAA